MVHVVVFVLTVEKDLLLVVLLEVFSRRHQEAGRTAGRVADHLVGAGGHQLHHHFDDVSGGAELPVHPGGGDLGQQELVHVAPNVTVSYLSHLLIDAVQCRDHLVQHQRRGDFEDGVVHILGVSTGLVPMEVFDERKHLLLHDGIHFLSWEVVEHRPLELVSRDGALPDAHFLCENALVGQPKHGGLTGPEVVRLVQIVDEHEIGHLLHHVQRVGDAARPEDFPEVIDFVFQFAGYHDNSFSLFLNSFTL